MDILQTILAEWEIQLILADTSLEPRLSTGDYHAFATSIGMQHGDGLSPVLFTVYLDRGGTAISTDTPSTTSTNHLYLPPDIE